MLIIVHENSRVVKKILFNEEENSIGSRDLVKEFWRLAGKYPQELLVWIDERFLDILNVDALKDIFHQDLIMASYAVREQFFPETIGYIDQSPFVNPKVEVPYPTWRMSTNVGGIKGETALKFRSLVEKRIIGFGYLLNAMAKIGQQNSLFCYSDPSFIKSKHEIKGGYAIAGTRDLFLFTFQFYKRIWGLVLFFCYIKYERRFPLSDLILGFLQGKRLKTKVDLKGSIQSKKESDPGAGTIDVIIPTLKRTELTKQVLVDLKNQTLPPSRVIIVEQDPEAGAVSKLQEVEEEEWPFEIILKFIGQTGACMARNIALEEVRSQWIFFADDDIRVSEDVLERSLSEIRRLGIYCLNLNCLQPGDSTVFNKIKQWGAFGSGTAIVSSKYAMQCRFDENFEYGFGEDTDFGQQLRAKGVDIIYHPNIKVTHLKAGRGGFRQILERPWETESLLPKPSPTMMLLAERHFTPEMMKGYKVALFLKYYKRQPIRNPLVYLKKMQKRWQLSEKWASEIKLGLHSRS